MRTSWPGKEQNYTGGTWMGQSITSDNTVLVRLTYYGDTETSMESSGQPRTWTISSKATKDWGWVALWDFNYDGIGR